MKQINIQHEANIQAQGKYNSKHCKPVVCLETGDVYTSMLDAADAAGVSNPTMVNHLSGKQRTVKGRHYVYLSRVNENLNSIVTRLRETSAMEDDARKWREHQAEQEAIRKAQEKRDAEIAKVRAKLEKLSAKCSRLEEEYNNAQCEYAAVEQELEALQNREA